MNRRQFLFSMGIGAVSLAGLDISPVLGFSKTKMPPAASSQDSPNIILINVDDLGWRDLSCYGSSFYETPNIDRLASQGMRFTNGYAACAVCSPTRASVMTGRYPARIGITDWIHHLDRQAYLAIGKGTNPVEYVETPERPLLCPPNPYWMELDEVTIAEMLQPKGYLTCHIGKWHLGDFWWYPNKQGFDVNIGGCEIGQPPTYFDPYYQNPRRSSIPTLRPRRQGEYLTDREADEAVKFIEKNKDKSFFLHYCPYAVHTPLEAKKELIQKYGRKRSAQQNNAVYAAMIESVDRAVGKILIALDEMNLSQRTLVIFTSDNGGLEEYTVEGGKKAFATDNAPLRAGKGYPYEGGIRVPLIIRWPGNIEAGSVCDHPAVSIDFFPTVCQAANIELPQDRVIDGESLMPLLLHKGSLRRQAIFWHFPHYRGSIVPYSIIRREQWKLIKRYEGKTFELFNLKEDLSEKQDLSNRMPQKVRELDDLLQAWLKETGAKLPVNRSQ
jgi:arylsulfatase A